MQQTGTWTAHDSAQANGGRYVYSSGSAEDTLSLSFSGPRLDVIYVQHPSLGAFVVEIDGAALQTVDSVAADSVFGARVSFNLTDGAHAVRIYPSSGTIAIDAFGVPAGQEPVVPPVEVTVEPPVEVTIEPPTEVTIEPPVVPTDVPAIEPVTPLPTELPVTPAPTVVPPGPDGMLPVLPLPLLDGADNAANWQLNGVWKIGPQAGMDGNGWVANAAQAQTSGLRGMFLVDLTTAQQPTLRFWQRMNLAAADSAVVDISLDGGQTWQTIDQQSGQTTEWGERVLDLSAYRGQMIRVRFRLEAVGQPGNGGDKNAWWIDNLSIQ